MLANKIGRRAIVLGVEKSDLCKAGSVLRDGGNVAFPTETVYGLGANALDVNAVQEIFKKKGRPLTDPLIVHVLNGDAALELVKARGSTKRIFKLLADSFWPGPLTMVLEASEKVPSVVCADSGFVGVRCPAHPVARDLLEESRVPVAAPSANRFGHVSPTSASHVLDDLGDQDIVVVDGGDITQGSCAVGIESTVLKVVDSSINCDEDADSDRELILFRKGGVSEKAIREVLDKAGFTRTKIVSPTKPDPEAEVPNEAPGQCVTHYAPDVDTWLLSGPTGLDIPAVDSVGKELYFFDETEGACFNLKACVLLDFGGSFKSLQPKLLAYRDLSDEGVVHLAAQRLFDALRWTESIDNAKHVLISDVSSMDNEHAPAVADRMFRAASGKVSKSYKVICK